MSLEADFSVSARKRSRPQDDPADASEFFRSGSDFRIQVREAVLSDMRRHAAGHPVEEVGGVLLGRHFELGNGYLVSITDHLAVRSESHSQFHFDFDASSIAMIFSRLEKGGDYVVGWYHSHTAGQPFMSEMDLRLHRNHFQSPWYVSCVLGAGEWGVPADFWHLVNGGLVNISGYALDIASGRPASATATHQGFLRACQLEESPRTMSNGYIARLLPGLGLPADGAIGRALLKPRPDDITVPTRLDDLRLITELSSALSADPAAMDEVALLHDRLALTRSYETVLAPLLITNQFGDETALCRARACSLTRGESTLSWLDLKQKAYWPVSVDTPIFAASFSADGTAWLLAEESQIVRLTLGSSPADEEGNPRFDCKVFRIKDVQGEPRQIVADDTSLWLHTSECLYQLPISTEQSRVQAGRQWELPDAEAHFLLGALSGAGLSSPLLTRSGDKLTTWAVHEVDVREATERVLPEPWVAWRLTHACAGALGLYLIFDNGQQSQLGLFDPGSLDLICHYLDDGDEGLPLSPSEVCADPFGQVFMRSGAILYRLRP